ncbi:DNA adenine methylase [Sphingobacterium siyangense]|uniref:DNA adenine methylase n=1 Tax=Sphingobacterium siyangense TaxID=459529 RepID=UPI003DA5D9FD
MKYNKITPFLKWAGGKRWLTEKIIDYLPESYNKYIEPFLGSGAVFFSLEPKTSILSDVNQSLIITYNTIKEDHVAVYNRLLEHSKKHCSNYYYEIRNQISQDKIELAARFIYLNRTCFNGLYRVNLKGQFNVPIGSKDKVILETDNFKKIADALANSEIINSDFEFVIDQAMEGDLVYIDPPYTVKHNNNGFVKYNEQMFTWADQVRLSEAIKRASNRGAHVILSNADHESIRDLYSFGKICSLSRNSVIASDPLNRGKYSELLVTL